MPKRRDRVLLVLDLRPPGPARESSGDLMRRRRDACVAASPRCVAPTATTRGAHPRAGGVSEQSPAARSTKGSGSFLTVETCVRRAMPLERTTTCTTPQLLKAPVDADPAPQGQRPPAQARTARRGRSAPARGAARGQAAKIGGQLLATLKAKPPGGWRFAILLKRWLLAFCAMSLDDLLDGASKTSLFLVPPLRAGPAREQVVR